MEKIFGFDDPRYAVGLLGELCSSVIDATAKAFPAAWQKAINSASRPFPYPAVVDACKLAHVFANSSKEVLHGEKRRGYRDLARKIDRVEDKLHQNQYVEWNHISSPQEIGWLAMEIATRAMAKRPRAPALESDFLSTSYPIEFTKRNSAVEVNFAGIEVKWRYKDAAQGKFHGPDARAAFEAAWLAGEKDAARKILTYGAG